MSQKKQKGRAFTRSGTPPIPTEAEWGSYELDLDRKWAHDQYCGRTNEEMQSYFQNSPIEGASDLDFMPEIPFRYYVIGYRDFVTSGNADSDAASCFLNLVLRKLENSPRTIVPVMPELVAAIEYVAQNQTVFEADIDIYGDFQERLTRIQALYAQSKDRYRRYP